jgi:two-component system chemotaxis sensor kinase CheA
MGETSNESTHLSAGIDLSQFYQVFFEEAGENLETMEQKLLNLDIENADEEELNAIFRCAHSVKGGAATFGFSDVAELTHQMETLLDKLRRHELSPTIPMVDVLLASGDALKAQLGRHQGSGAAPVDTTELLSSIRALVEGGSAPVAAPRPLRCAGPSHARCPGARHPLKHPLQRPPSPVCATSSSPSGPWTTRPWPTTWLSSSKRSPAWAPSNRWTPAARPMACAASRWPPPRPTTTCWISSASTSRVNKCAWRHWARDTASMKAHPVRRPTWHQSPRPMQAMVSSTMHPARRVPPPHRHRAADAAAAAAPAAPPVAARPAAAPAGRIEKAAGTAESSTLRVSVDKVDQLINLVGELVITQAMLAQNSKGVDAALYQQMASGLTDLERNTRDLQEAVMSIRMIPMSLVFNRFPRMLRDLAGKLGKKVELVQVGEATELDKGLVEKITDPLTHLVRNSCDHGIEMPAERIAKGKPEHGTVTLVASHQGGSIVIEVRDDGKGLNREKLLKKARERGLDAPDSMTDQDVYALIFAPGFSTADVVTDVSGRGVGMDVVKKNITALGGTVEIDSAEGYGMTVRVRLPLTLAIMDGMSVGVGEECYILPLSSVVESFQVQPGVVKTIGTSGRVVEVRDEYMPVVDLERVFNVPRFDADTSANIMVVIEAEGGRVALLVDELLGQQQVVVKNLESNYRRVDDVSGATIMGDGRVALILDVGSLVRRSRH